MLIGKFINGDLVIFEEGVIPVPQKKNYQCCNCDLATSRYYATNNTPKLGHVCTYCFGMLPESEQTHYVQE